MDRACHCVAIPLKGGKGSCTATRAWSNTLRAQVNSSLVLPIDEVAPDAVDSSGEPVDAKLYATFWGLQSVFKVRGWEQ